jgi:hypothetical protein
MNTVHTALQPMNREAKANCPDHLHVFREFLNHLDRAAKYKPAFRSAKDAKVKAKSGGK